MTYSMQDLERLSQELKIDVSEVKRVIELNLSIFDMLKKRADTKGCTIKEIVKSDIESLRKLDEEGL